MKQQGRDGTDPAALDELIAKITVDAGDDDTQHWAFRQALVDNVSLPCDAHVIGEPVSVVEFGYDGNSRRGVTARCRRADGSEHLVSAAEVFLPGRVGGARYLAAYRRWLGIEPDRIEVDPPSRRKRQHKATQKDLEAGGPTELVILSIKERAARCRLLKSERVITLRAIGYWGLIPGEIVVVKARKQWNYAGHPYLSGEIESTRLDVAALGLVPLRLDSVGTWDPSEEYWGEADEPIEDWARPIIAKGPRPMFEMEQVLPGAEPENWDFDPITESNEWKEAGDLTKARRMLMDLCQEDLRCLDAHAHLGNFVFDHRPASAIRHYAVGVSIGELSLGADFGGVLAWGFVDNRPFLRCLHGMGLCLWRLGRFDEAARVFDRVLWLNPSDNQGVRFLIDQVRDRRDWGRVRD